MYLYEWVQSQISGAKRKLDHKFCKCILGLKKIAYNISAKSELGRFPITDYIKTQAMLYLCRLQTDPINPLLKEAFSICKSVFFSFQIFY